MKEKVKQQPFRSSYDNLIRYNGLNAMFRPVPNDALYFLVNKNSIDDFFSMMKYSLYATKKEKLISDLNEAFVENNPCFGNSITKFRSKNTTAKNSPQRATVTKVEFSLTAMSLKKVNFPVPLLRVQSSAQIRHL